MFIVDGLKPPTVLGTHGKIWAQMKIWGIFLCLKMGAASRKCGFWCSFHQGIWHRAQERLGCCGVPGALCAEPKLQNGTWAATLAKIGELKQQKWCKTLVLTSKDGGLSSKKGGFKDKN